MDLTPTSSTSTDPLEAVVEQLFADMLLAYGKRFGDMWGGSTADALIAFWVRGLRGYTPREIKRGIAALDTRPWPPTLPEFKALCRPAIDPLVAYYEAVAGVQDRAKGEMGKWSHPAIYWAAMPMTFDLGNQTYSQVKTRWEKAFFEQMDKGEWEAIPAPMLALEAPKPMTREEADAALKSIKAGMPTKATTSLIDHRRWAKRILERERNGDKTLSAYQVKEARAAMEASL